MVIQPNPSPVVGTGQNALVFPTKNFEGRAAIMARHRDRDTDRRGKEWSGRRLAGSAVSDSPPLASLFAISGLVWVLMGHPLIGVMNVGIGVMFVVATQRTGERPPT
jgi:hypothetical protein